jgi:hypothetical protein
MDLELRSIFSKNIRIWLLVAAVAASAAAAADNPANGYFSLRFDGTGIISLQRPGDAYPTEYIAPGRTLGEITVRYRKSNGKWQDFTAGKSGERLDVGVSPADASRRFVSSSIDRYYTFHADFNDFYADLEVRQSFQLVDEALIWTIRIRNLSGDPIEIGDIALPMPFNTEERWNPTVSHTLRVVSHSFISGHGSFLFWMRPNGVGPCLVMTPLAGAVPDEGNLRPSKLEFFDERGVYIHSAASGEAARQLGGNWRQPHTSATLGPASSADSEAAYAFKFQWAPGYEGVRDVLYKEGLADIQVAPGMTLPTDLAAWISFRTKNGAPSILPEHPAETKVEYIGEKGTDVHVYKVSFSRPGENRLTVGFGEDGRSLGLEFFVTEPLETLYKKRAAFLANNQLHRNPAKWYDGLFSEWDMKNAVLRSPDDLDGLKDYWMASDDPALCKAPYLAEKNVYYPDAGEIEALEYHIRNFVWGKLQRTDREKYPYGIYGIPDWKVNRESGPSDRRGWKDHLWRVYDYPHVIMLYLDMYKIARDNPRLVRYLDKDGYLERAFGTARAYFTVPLQTGNWDAHRLTNFNEMVIGDLIAELEANGRRSEAAAIRKEWEAKVRHYVNDNPNIFIAEYPFGPCGFESTHAFAKYALEQISEGRSDLGIRREDAAKFMEWQTTANIALRGWLETAYYLLGSSDPGSLFYMSQMGGWSIVDYALHFAKDPAPYLKLGYASFLSGWALLNSGPPETNYGFWYPGKANDGAASGGFILQAFGHRMGKPQGRGAWSYGGEQDLGFGAALRTAATIVAEDPVFGWIAYGGELSRGANGFGVIPKDGLRRRLHVIQGDSRFHVILDRDGFARGKAVIIDASLAGIEFMLENRMADAHRTPVRITGLAQGSYRVDLDGKTLKTVEIKPGAETVLILPLGKKAESAVAIRKIRG